MSGVTSTPIEVHQIDGDSSVVCCVLVASHKIVIAVNSRYPYAEEHARAHLAAEPDRHVWICKPSCGGGEPAPGRGRGAAS